MCSPAAAKAAIAQAGLADAEFELISVDDDWQAATCAAIAAQLRAAGIRITCKTLPGATFWNDGLKYPFSATEWTMRPLGVPTFSLACKTDAAWNESALKNAELDAALAEALSIADADKRRVVMARIEQIMQEEGVPIQPCWRSLFRHVRPGVNGPDQHPMIEHHHDKRWISA